MIRVVAGRFKGRRLRTPAGSVTRPTTGRIKEAMFSSLGRRIEGRIVADLYSGSGALGIEALSRGARRVVFVEFEPGALKIIRSNLQELGVGEEEAMLRRMDAGRWLRRLQHGAVDEGERVEVVLMDPPYASGDLESILGSARALVTGGMIDLVALEHSARLTPFEEVGEGLRVVTRRHGHSAFSILERAKP